MTRWYYFPGTNPAHALRGDKTQLHAMSLCGAAEARRDRLIPAALDAGRCKACEARRAELNALRSGRGRAIGQRLKAALIDDPESWPVGAPPAWLGTPAVSERPGRGRWRRCAGYVLFGAAVVAGAAAYILAERLP